MPHSTVTKKGETTIPDENRSAMRIEQGDQLQYQVAGDHVTIGVEPGTKPLKGALASDKGSKLSFAQIREALT